MIKNTSNYLNTENIQNKSYQIQNNYQKMDFNPNKQINYNLNINNQKKNQNMKNNKNISLNNPNNNQIFKKINLRNSVLNSKTINITPHGEYIPFSKRQNNILTSPQ